MNYLLIYLNFIDQIIVNHDKRRDPLRHTPSVSKQKLRLDIICVTKQKVRLVKFLSNFIKRFGMLPETV
jgi:hypothetical protein